MGFKEAVRRKQAIIETIKGTDNSREPSYFYKTSRDDLDATEIIFAPTDKGLQQFPTEVRATASMPSWQVVHPGESRTPKP